MIIVVIGKRMTQNAFRRHNDHGGAGSRDESARPRCEPPHRSEGARHHDQEDHHRENSPDRDNMRKLDANTSEDIDAVKRRHNAKQCTETVA